MERREEIARIIETCWQDLAEKTDRTSPAEYPEMCLITYDELADYLRDAAALPSPAPVAGEGKALGIASRVLDPGAEEKMARIIDPAAWAKFDRQRAELVRLGMDLETERGPWMYVEPSLKAARAVLAWMRGEMGSSSAITAGSACGANEAQHSDGEG